ncbi:MAG: phosphoribosyltransferase [Candidatus Kuenenia sp.]|nr:phosphoribosyltransferase [Candidatus Kuenenia hertensis]
MHTFIEDKSFRNKLYVFKDRSEAGKLLSQRLGGYKDTDAIVLGIPSGGVPVAAKIAKALALPLDVLIVRKVQIPYNTEAGFGSVSPDNNVLLNESLLNTLNLSAEEVNQQIQRTREIIKKRNDLFRKGLPFPTVKNKVAIIVDDGLASGYTMLSAIAFIKRLEPQKIVVAVPTGLKKTVDLVLSQADELVCLNVRSGFIFAVADAYENWYDLEDDEVISLLQNFKEST